MSTKNLRLKKNLRKSILRGSPWIYREALQDTPLLHDKSCNSQFVKVFDQKRDFVCWAIFCPTSVITARVFSLKEKINPQDEIRHRIKTAVSFRKHFDTNKTNAYRLINGEGDNLPGLVCDRYNNLLVLQCDGQDLSDFWNIKDIAHLLLELTSATSVYYKVRSGVAGEHTFYGEELTGCIDILENNQLFEVNFVEGQKTGFFLDQRDNRNYVKKISANKSVLNLFSYTGGFSVAAGAGKASKVISCDRSKEALKNADLNWEKNSFPRHHSTLCLDLFNEMETINDKFDIVICDPPSLAKSEKHKQAAIQQYIQIFSQAARLVNNDGHLLLSSCSSHITFEDFFEITNETLSKSRLRGKILRVSGQGEDHPFPHVNQHLRYLKFFAIRIEK